MKILIATGIYPPSIGGPAQYAKNLHDAFVHHKHDVRISVFGDFLRYPWGIRHGMFFFYVIPDVFWADYVCVLDPFLAGVVAILGKIFGRKVVFRTGGDLLWEFYAERTKEKVLFRDFYKTRIDKLSLKEKVTFYLLGWALRNVSAMIWSTEWQRDIFMTPYNLEKQNHFIIENYYGPKEGDLEPARKEFIGSTRKLIWKNLDTLEKVFDKIRNDTPEVQLFHDNLPFSLLMQKMSQSYAVILVSVGDISPNMILDAIRHNRPFICTRECGIYERIKDAGTFVDPEDPTQIENAVRELLTEEGYKKAKEKVRNFNFIHTWDQIAHEFLKVFEKI